MAIFIILGHLFPILATALYTPTNLIIIFAFSNFDRIQIKIAEDVELD